MEEVARIRKQFKVFREARKVHVFELELCVCTWGSVGEEPVRILEEAVAEEKAENGFLFDPYVEITRSGPALAIEKSVVLRGRIRRACQSLSLRCSNYIATEIQLKS